jgi:hypothetical protein
MKSKNAAPKPGTRSFTMSVLPERKYLDKAIADDGFCRPDKCWHKVAIAAIVLAWGETNSRVHVDAGHVKMIYRGWRYSADTPRHVKRSLILFDKELYDQVQIREYQLRFRRMTKVIPLTQKRRDQVNAARREREKNGTPDKRNYPNLRKRVVGFSASV